MIALILPWGGIWLFSMDSPPSPVDNSVQWSPHLTSPHLTSQFAGQWMVGMQAVDRVNFSYCAGLAMAHPEVY